MNRFIKTSMMTSLAALTAVGTIMTGTASAGFNPSFSHAEHRPDMIVQTQGNALTSATNAAYTPRDQKQIDQVVRHWKDGKFDVMPVASVDDNQLNSWLSNRKAEEPRQVADLQSAIRANPHLSAKLKARNVEFDNIVGADQAIDGSMTFYVQ